MTRGIVDWKKIYRVRDPPSQQSAADEHAVQCNRTTLTQKTEEDMLSEQAYGRRANLPSSFFLTSILGKSD